jgi:hypothetical protein
MKMATERVPNRPATDAEYSDPKGYSVNTPQGTPTYHETLKSAHDRDKAVNGNKSRITNKSNPSGNPKPKGWFE